MTDELKQWEYDRGYEKGKTEVLDKIIAEIETDLSHFCFDDWGNEKSPWKEVKAIIEKYRKEQE